MESSAEIQFDHLICFLNSSPPEQFPEYIKNVMNITAMHENNFEILVS